MIISLMQTFSNSTLVAGTLSPGAETDRQCPARGFVTINMLSGEGMEDHRLRIGRAAEEWPYAL